MEMILRRLTMAPVREPVTKQREFAQQVAQKLQYTRLAHEVERQEEDTALLCELIAMGHAPYSAQSVKLYQRLTVLRANAKMVMPWMLGALVSLGALFWAIYQVVQAYPKGEGYAGVIALAVCGVFISTTRTIYLWSQRDYEWTFKPLAYYDRPIPQSALRVALDIKEHAARNIEFGVENLQQKERPRIVDPFLIASRGGQRFYVAVWDEPKFEEGPKHEQ